MTEKTTSFLEEITPILTAMKSNFNLLVFGKKGYGKTSWIRGLLKNRVRVIFIDTLEYEYDERDGVIVRSYKALLDALLDNPESFRVVFRCWNEIERVFNLWAHIDHTTLVVEEADKFDEEKLEILLEHIDRGRHNENNLILLTRWPTELHADLRKGIDSIVSFQQDDVNTMAYLAKINKDVVSELPKLKRGEVRILVGEEYLKEFYYAQAQADTGSENGQEARKD